MGIPDEARAYFLGHDVNVNKENYWDYKRQKEIKKNKAFEILKKFEGENCINLCQPPRI